MIALWPRSMIAGSTTTWAENTGRPEVIVQTCSSCTSVMPGSAAMCRRISSSSMPLGLASSRMSMASASSRQVLGRISAPTASDAIGSASANPVALMMIPVTMTAAAPRVSAATSRNALRTFRLCAWPCRRTSSEQALAASAPAPKAISSVELTGGGDISRRMASVKITPAMASNRRELAIAARISALA